MVAVTGFVQHRAVLHTLAPSPDEAPTASRVPHVAAAIGCVLVCALLTVYVAANAT